MKHNHHIIPRHAWDKCHDKCPPMYTYRKHDCGFDDPTNLVELSVHDHAEVHKWLFIEHGRAQDALAWLSLYGQMTHQEVWRECAALGGRTGGPKLKGVPKSERHKKALRKPHRPFNMTEETKAKLRKPKSASHREAIRLSKIGSKNPMFGKGPNSGSIKPGEHRSPRTEFKRKS